MHLIYTSKDDLPLSYGNEHAAGIDIRSNMRISLPPRVLRKVTTGVSMAIPEGHVGLFRGRSGWAFGQGVFAFEGTIDPDYRGEISVLLINFAETTREVLPGDRVGQIVVVPAMRPELVRGEELPPTPDGGRGLAGFGSTGVR